MLFRSYGKADKELTNIKKHRKHVLSMKRRYEEQERYKKFIMVYKGTIRNICLNIINKRLEEINTFKKILYLWISIVKIFKMGNMMYKIINKIKKERELANIIYFNSIRIYIFIKSRLSKISPNVDLRLKKKLHRQDF